MNNTPRMQSAPIAGTEGGRRITSFGGLAEPACVAEVRGPVLPPRGASRQLELPFLAPMAPTYRLRTG